MECTSRSFAEWYGTWPAKALGSWISKVYFNQPLVYHSHGIISQKLVEVSYHKVLNSCIRTCNMQHGWYPPIGEQQNQNGQKLQDHSCTS